MKSKSVFKNQDEEILFTLTWSAVEEFVRNAYKSKARWNRSGDAWDLHCYFLALQAIFENVCDLSFFCKKDQAFGRILKNYKTRYEALNVRGFRNQGIHRKKVNNLKTSKGVKVVSKVIVVGGFNASKNEFTIMGENINLDKAFELIHWFRKEIRSLLKERRNQYYLSKANAPIDGIIPFSHTHSYAEALKGRKPGR